MSDFAARCLELCEIRSVTGDEGALADHVEAWAARVAPDDYQRIGNALVVGAPDHDRPCVALVGHLDTVPPTPDYSGSRRTTDKVIGLGASDMKGALAVMQLLYEGLDLGNLPFALCLVFYDREEGPYADNGLEPLLNQCDAMADIDLAIAMEPTDNTLQLGCVGSLQARAIFRGQACHSARPWEGKNAIHAAGPFLQRLLEREAEPVQVGDLVFYDTIAVTMAQGGRARNVVPDRFEVNINHRFAPRGGAEAACDRAAQRLRRMLGPEVTLEILDASPPGPVPRDNPLLLHLVQTTQVPVRPKQAWTDVARLALYGIDAVNFGPGQGSQAHQAGEWISIAAMEEAYALLERFLQRAP
jgi:succinyl-diaminopimelate desuccinylase